MLVCIWMSYLDYLFSWKFVYTFKMWNSKKLYINRLIEKILECDQPYLEY